jgi:carbonic anhydrase
MNLFKYPDRIDKVLVQYKCNKLYFRMGGEHIINGNKYGMELQFICTGRADGSGQDTIFFISIPVEVLPQDSIIPQAKFFDIFDSIKPDSLPLDINITSFSSIFNAFSMFHKIYYYMGTKPFPDCDILMNWMFIDNPSYISKDSYMKIMNLFNGSIPAEGNYRNAITPQKDDFYFFYLIGGH